MFLAIIITFVITTLCMLVLMLLGQEQRQDKENERLRRSNDRLNNQISGMLNRENTRRERDAYDQGLYDGRSTDTLYRNVLGKYRADEQPMVMMYGDEGRK